MGPLAAGAGPRRPEKSSNPINDKGLRRFKAHGKQSVQEAKTILVPLAEGFEEIEAVAIIDVLRRADLHVTVAGLEEGPVTGAHGLVLGTDRALDDVDEVEGPAGAAARAAEWIEGRLAR